MVEKTRFDLNEKPKHPLGWACENCFHVIKDSRPGSAQMVCHRYPPTAHMVQQGIASIHPPVSKGEWCGEFALAPAAAN
jgi:hypothetical protein